MNTALFMVDKKQEVAQSAANRKKSKIVREIGLFSASFDSYHCDIVMNGCETIVEGNCVP